MPTGIELITEERYRQIADLGYDVDHDREHVKEELAFAAACLVAPTDIYLLKADVGEDVGAVRWVRPWPGWDGRPERPVDEVWDDVDERLDELAKAGALIAAEMDRIMFEQDVE